VIFDGGGGGAIYLCCNCAIFFDSGATKMTLVLTRYRMGRGRDRMGGGGVTVDALTHGGRKLLMSRCLRNCGI
jgi:hypothetical protein